MQAKTERFEMRLDQEVLDRIDRWRAAQDDLPSRAEAIRRLVDSGLQDGEERQIKFSDGERFLMIMMRDLYNKVASAKPNFRGEIDPDLVAEAIFGGHLWGLGREYPGIFEAEEDDRATVTEVGDILDMWWLIEMGYSRLSDEDKARIAKEVAPLGDDVQFEGFDGNYETRHMSIARFLIEHLGRFTNFKGRDLNSHYPSLEGYRRMLQAYRPIREGLKRGDLTVSDIIAMLQARARSAMGR